jgi:cytochrome c nitrite reductase small subunit
MPSKRPWTGTRLLGLSLPALFLCLLIGTGLGAGGYTMHYAEGLSYLSDDPKGCVNCHVMRDHYDGWQKASHHGVATCNDCHLNNHSFVARYGSKARNGLLHSKAFTFQDFHEPIRIHPHNSRILQDNCVRCHEGVVHSTLTAGRDGKPPTCAHCHQQVGHGPVR